MAFVSVTRLRPRAWRFLPQLLLHTWRSARVIGAASGFHGGYLATGRGPVFWTITVWTDEAAMRAFRGAEPHLSAMPLLMQICDEAAVAHWTAASPAPPAPEEAARAMAHGRLSKLKNPSAAHAEGATWPDRRVPVMGPPLRPRA
jgi:hypothetical protein